MADKKKWKAKFYLFNDSKVLESTMQITTKAITEVDFRKLLKLEKMKLKQNFCYEVVMKFGQRFDYEKV